jgi:hypothetical protein
VLDSQSTNKEWGDAMAQAIWCDEDDLEVAGSQVGFLVRVVHENERHVRYVLKARPPHTNQSHEPRLRGWCGTSDNIARYGCGLARVSRVTGNGRAQLVRVEPTPEILESLGYPGLIGGV